MKIKIEARLERVLEGGSANLKTTPCGVLLEYSGVKKQQNMIYET